MDENALKVWSEIKEKLRSELDSSTFEDYFASVNEIYKVNNNCIYLVVENMFYKKRINDGYLDKMNYLLSGYYPEKHMFVLMTKEEVLEAQKEAQKQNIGFERQDANGLNPNFTFQTFVVGDSNRLAHRYAMLVAEQLSSVANPIYIFGDVGLGKTHLMQAIGNSIVQFKENKNVLYIRTQDFVEDYVKSSKFNDYEKFSQKFKNIDVLLIDDIQFLESKQQCQLEFFKIFERLNESKKLIVITSDRKASDLQNVMQRLTSRFEWGMSLDINKPNKEHRVEILRSKIAQELPDPSVVPEDVIDYIADVCQSNIRELEGALNRVLFYCSAFSTNISLESAREALKNIVNSNEEIKNISVPSQDIKKIMSVVTAYFKLGQDDLVSNSKKKNVVYARQICWYLMRKICNLTLQKIGDIFNGKDHSTVSYGYQIIEDAMQNDEETKKNVENILRKMGKDVNAT